MLSIPLEFFASSCIFLMHSFYPSGIFCFHLYLLEEVHNVNSCLDVSFDSFRWFLTRPSRFPFSSLFLLAYLYF